jgi:predicted ATP-grasp superfamily ATP-dependent carboligase/protein-tyrosine-phosphatase
MKKTSVLLLGCNERAAFSIAKSFTKNNCSVDVLNDCFHPLQYSRFVNSFHVIPSSFEKKTNTAVNEIIAFLQKNQYDYLIPVNDTALLICAINNEHISRLTKIAYVNPSETHKYSRDKSELLMLCKNLGLPTPASILIEKIEDIDKLENIAFPCIAKPVSSKVYRNEKIFSYTVKKMKTREALIDFIRETIDTVPVLIQELLPKGFGVGYNFLSLNGKVLDAYCHQRINEAWGGGQSTFRKTIDVSTFDLENISKKIIAQINWTGIAMIEFMIVNNTPYIMEINGRAWGSIELGIFSGVDLPYNMVEAIYEDKKIEVKKSSTTFYSRNLLNEILWITKSKSFSTLIKWFISLKESFKKNHIIEDSVFRDPLFRIAYVFKLISEIFSKFLFKIEKSVTPVRVPTLSNQYISKDKSIALICKGNINRSAFAEFYWKQNHPGYKISSFGTIFKENRLSPVNAVASAKAFGVDLNQHRSKFLTDTAILENDLFVIMDKDNYWDLIKMKVPKNKIFKLNSLDISDPYGNDNNYFNKTFKIIAESVDAVFK